MLGTLDKNLILRKVDLFAGLTFEDLTAISRIAQPARFEEGSAVFRQGDPGDCLYVVLEGRVTIVLETERGERPLTEVGQHGYFGEMAILDEKPRSATARAAASTMLLSIGKNDFHDLLSEYPDLGLALLRSMTERIRLIQRGEPTGG